MPGLIKIGMTNQMMFSMYSKAIQRKVMSEIANEIIFICNFMPHLQI